MGLLGWLFGAGLPGAISRDLINRYLGFKSKVSDATESELLEMTFGSWLADHVPMPDSESDFEKSVRLNIIVDRQQGLAASKSLYDVFKDVLYIEAEVTVNDVKSYDAAVKVFVDNGRKRGLDFSKHYESERELLSRVGLR